MKIARAISVILSIFHSIDPCSIKHWEEQPESRKLRLFVLVQQLLCGQLGFFCCQLETSVLKASDNTIWTEINNCPVLWPGQEGRQLTKRCIIAKSSDPARGRSRLAAGCRLFESQPLLLLLLPADKNQRNAQKHLGILALLILRSCA